MPGTTARRGRLGRRTVTVGLVAGAFALGVVSSPASAAPRWQEVTPDLADTLLYEVESGRGATWAVGIEASDWTPVALRWTGRGWADTSPLGSGSLSGIAPGPGGEAWAVGTSGADEPVAQHWDGTAWQSVGLPLPDGMRGGLYSVAVSPEGTVWVGGGAFPAPDDPSGVREQLLLSRGTDGTWTRVAVPADGSVGSTISILAVADDDVYVLGSEGFAHFDGTSWTRQRLPAGLADRKVVLYDIERRGDGELWAVGHVEDDALWRRPVVLRFDGRAWNEVPVPEETAELHGITFDRNGRPVIVGQTIDLAVDPAASYLLTTDRHGRLVRRQSPAGAGMLESADTDDAGRVWVAGAADNVADPSVTAPYAAVRD
ncbi:hypothetical protein [Streptomyces sp. RFCAC02]|uniref:hypothetical protein n=1 Tax=Streptomyces sp. RFCAC02 TaxID=2499143 RepID=UPI0010206FAC|nr:hypothetical protein [Streptomyces sp. RFCAC02]